MKIILPYASEHHPIHSVSTESKKAEEEQICSLLEVRHLLLPSDICAPCSWAFGFIPGLYTVGPNFQISEFMIIREQRAWSCRVCALNLKLRKLKELRICSFYLIKASVLPSLPTPLHIKKKKKNGGRGKTWGWGLLMATQVILLLGTFQIQSSSPPTSLPSLLTGSSGHTRTCTFDPSIFPVPHQEHASSETRWVYYSLMEGKYIPWSISITE